MGETMAPDATDFWDVDEQRRLRDQRGMMRRANPDGVERDSGPTPELAPTFDRNHVLFATDEIEVGQVDEVFTSRTSEFVGAGRVVDNPIDGLAVYEVPERTGGRRRSAKSALRALRDTFNDDRRIFPDHLLHVSADHGRPCPATEPEETGLDHPGPRQTGLRTAGGGVTVAVVDTGRYQPSEHHWMTRGWIGNDVFGDDEVIAGDLHEYAGHGTFIAGVVRCRAPKATIRHERFKVKGGTVRESALIRQLNDALDHNPHIVNLSAGTHTRSNDPLRSFDVLWEKRLKAMKDTVVVAAAGNDGSNQKFFPAALPWCVGVGSLDRDERMSRFSNYGTWVDVFAIGRNHVNAYPQGRYICKETPDKGDIRWFNTGLARWSGTSFATPFVAGILAALAAERPAGKTVTEVKDDWLASTTALKSGSDPVRGNFKFVGRPYA
jgi:hypothetical protein